MKSLGHILNSKARVEILQVLSQLTRPVGLRKLARICDLHPRSVELALKSLGEEKRIRTVAASRGPTYAFDWAHPDAARLRRLFEVDAQERLKGQKTPVRREGKALCAFIEDGLALLARGRDSYHAAK